MEREKADSRSTRMWKAFLLVVILITFGLIFYRQVIYYQLPSNPLSVYGDQALEEFHLTINKLDSGEETVSCHGKEACQQIGDYLTQLRMKPLKPKRAAQLRAESDQADNVTGMMRFEKSDSIYLSDLNIDQPTVLAIRSSEADFKGAGDYQLSDGGFDYERLFELAGGERQ